LIKTLLICAIIFNIHIFSVIVYFIKLSGIDFILGLNSYIAMIVLGYLGQSDIAMILLFPYVMFTLAYATKHKISNFGKYGEFSYGIYLWGWPIQQIIVSICGNGMNAYLNAIITIPIAFIMAVITYYVVEKPALKFK
jgi:peptidoglycan/LPS O-acetylase OafA/YrhL